MKSIDKAQHQGVIQLPPSYAALLEDIKERIRTAQVKAAVASSRELIGMYWYVGKSIVERQHKDGWGNAVVDKLAADLQRAFPGMEGFSPRNVWRMRAFYLAWTEALQKLSPPRLEGRSTSA